MWTNISHESCLCNVGPWLTDNFSQQNSLCNVVSIKLGQHCIGILYTLSSCPNISQTTLCNIGFERKTVTWKTIMYLQYCTQQLPAQCQQCCPTVLSLVSVFDIWMRQHGTRKLLVKCWARAHRYAFAGKLAVFGCLFFNQIKHHQAILALFVQCWLGSLFMACKTAMNMGQHWLEQLQWNTGSLSISHLYSVLLSDNYGIVKAFSRNLGSTNLAYSEKVNLQFLSGFPFKAFFLFLGKEKLTEFTYFTIGHCFYPSSLNFCYSEFNYITTAY